MDGSFNVNFKIIFAETTFPWWPTIRFPQTILQRQELSFLVLAIFTSLNLNQCLYFYNRMSKVSYNYLLLLDENFNFDIFFYRKVYLIDTITIHIPLALFVSLLM